MRWSPHAVVAILTFAFQALPSGGSTPQSLAPASVERLLERLAPAIVNVELTLRVEFGFGGNTSDEESSIEVRGAIVDPKGLIMVSNLYLAPQRMREMAASFGDGSREFRFNMQPTAIRVQLPGAPDEVPGFLAASDADLDLAFIQLEQPGAEALPFVDFSRARAAKLGESVVTISRLLANFDRSPLVYSGLIAGELKKPRRAWIVHLPAAALGLPVFSADGTPLGVMATMVSSSQGSRDAGGFLFNLTEGSGDPTRGPLGFFMIPAERVRAAVGLARERAQALLEERAGASPPSQP